MILTYNSQLTILNSYLLKKPAHTIPMAKYGSLLYWLASSRTPPSALMAISGSG